MANGFDFFLQASDILPYRGLRIFLGLLFAVTLIDYIFCHGCNLASLRICAPSMVRQTSCCPLVLEWQFFLDLETLSISTASI
jgi:hypothetical protein